MQRSTLLKASTSALLIQTLGELSVRRDDEPLSLPAANKAQALLTHLLLYMHPQRRDRLCELFWNDQARHIALLVEQLRCIVNAAAQIPSAEFVSLNSDSHLLLGRETASQV